MTGRHRLPAAIACAAIILACSAIASAATIRPAGDPDTARVIWADPFDFYGQWNWDNRDNPTPGAQLYHGGPVPVGAPNPIGKYPGKIPRPPGGEFGCGSTIQTSPADWEMARTQWLSNDCPVIWTPIGQGADPGSFEANADPLCGLAGELATTRGMWATANYTWGQGGTWSSMAQFRHNFSDRIQAIATYRGLDARDSINGTDEHPLVVIFYLHDKGNLYGSDPNIRSVFQNSYVELTLGNDTAPTDYIWRGEHERLFDQPECCPQGPFPIVCQQVREVNTGYTEGADDVEYVNAHCPPLVPPFDAQTGQGKTWKSLAFGFLAILDKDPCQCNEGQSWAAHRPTSDHFAVFDGNVWRQIRNNRYRGLVQSGTTVAPTPNAPQAWNFSTWKGIPWPWDPYMALDTNVNCNNFGTSGGNNLVVLKITTDYMLIYCSNAGGTGQWHAAVPRVYKGPFDTIRWGVGPGCELDPMAYVCKSGGTPKQCLTYSTHDCSEDGCNSGYDRTQMDSMSILDGDLYPSPVTGACCKPDGTCLEGVSQLTCSGHNGVYHGEGSTCAQYLCCPTPFADVNHDGDVDQDDFGAFQLCYTGPAGGVPTGCACFDRNANGSINSEDLTSFINCWTGPNVQWTQILAPSCAP